MFDVPNSDTTKIGKLEEKDRSSLHQTERIVIFILESQCIHVIASWKLDD